MATASEISSRILPLEPNLLPFRIYHRQPILIFVVNHCLVVKGLLVKKTQIVFVFLVILVILNHHVAFKLEIKHILSFIEILTSGAAATSTQHLKNSFIPLMLSWLTLGNGPAIFLK